MPSEPEGIAPVPTPVEVPVVPEPVPELVPEPPVLVELPPVVVVPPLVPEPEQGELLHTLPQSYAKHLPFSPLQPPQQPLVVLHVLSAGQEPSPTKSKPAEQVHGELLHVCPHL